MDEFAKQLEDEIMNYTSDCEEKEVGTSERSYEQSDTTECSSSFDGSDCEADTLDDSEVLSGFHGVNESAPDIDGLLTGRKKLSSHWRNFICPLMWRCKWAELQINNLMAQSRRYDKKLQAYSQINLVKLEATTSGGHGLKLPTFSQNTASSEPLRRKKRRRAEAIDHDGVEAYMLSHNIFSYHENRKYLDQISHSMAKNSDAPKGVDSDVEFGNVELFCDESGSCEKSLEDLLRKIDLLQSRVLKLRTRADKLVVSEQQAGKPSSADTLCSPPLSHNAALSSPPSTTYRMPTETYLVSQLMSEYNLGGLLLPETDVLGNGEVESNANGSRNLDHLANAYEDEDEYDEEILIDNQRVKEQLLYLEERKTHSINKPRALGSTSINPQAPQGTDDQPRMKTCSKRILPKRP